MFVKINFYYLFLIFNSLMLINCFNVELIGNVLNSLLIDLKKPLKVTAMVCWNSGKYIFILFQFFLLLF